MAKGTMFSPVSTDNRATRCALVLLSFMDALITELDPDAVRDLRERFNQELHGYAALRVALICIAGVCSSVGVGMAVGRYAHDMAEIEAAEHGTYPAEAAMDAGLAMLVMLLFLYGAGKLLLNAHRFGDFAETTTAAVVIAVPTLSITVAVIYFTTVAFALLTHTGRCGLESPGSAG